MLTFVLRNKNLKVWWALRFAPHPAPPSPLCQLAFSGSHLQDPGISHMAFPTPTLPWRALWVAMNDHLRVDETGSGI